MIYISKDNSKNNKKSKNNNKTKGRFINVEFGKDNISKRYPNGRTFQTQDRFLPIDKKGKSDNKKEDPRVIVIDSNRNDELAVVRFTSQKNKNSSSLPEKRDKTKNEEKSYFKHFIEIEDDEGNPIKADGYKFK